MTATANGKWTYPKQKPTPGKVCKDCVAEGVTTRRPAPHSGPRCTTHHNAEKRRRRLAAKVRHVEKTYDMTDEEYDALYAYQGGLCALCRRATGARGKRLAVDHDHRAGCGHDPSKGCKLCTRGLVCSVCNDILAHARDEAGFGVRLSHYLQSWPTRRMRSGGQWPPTARSV